MTTTAVAEGAGSIAIGGDAINSIFVTGGVNQFFVGQYERLADAYLSPQALYRELALDDFVGREWVVAEIDEFLAAHGSGYVVIEADAGMGKTAFIAWLARQRRYVHHFVRLMPDPDDVGVALRSMAAQLIRAWDLQDRAIGGVLPPTASRPDFFEELLGAVATKRDAVKPGEPIVLVVDGLNETTPRAGQNPLALPATLPPGVFFVVSQRTVHVPLDIVVPRTVVRVTADADENLSDMRAFVRAAAAAPDLAARLADAGVEIEAFVDGLVDRSKGVWLVLRYVLPEIRSGVRLANDLDTLPAGLWHYYAQFWHGWQAAHGDEWAEVDRPLLMLLTALEEPATVAHLCDLGGFADVERVSQLLADDWRPFLQVIEDIDDERYTPFHASLAEFAAGQIDRDTLAAAERTFVRQLAAQHRDAHQRIARRYLDAWGGMEAGLPALRDERTALDGGYGLRHLVSHLARGGQDAELHRLLALEWPGAAAGALEPDRPRNAWYEAHRRTHQFAAYVLDLQRAWTETGAADGAQLVLAFRYAAIAATLNSLAGNVPAELLRILVERGSIAADEAIALAREALDPRARAEALTNLAPVLEGDQRDAVLRDALASVQAVPDGYWRAGELARLITVLGADHADDVRRIADGMVDRDFRDVLRWIHDGALGAEGLPPPRASVLAPDPPLFLAQYVERTRQAVVALLAGVGAPGPAAADELATRTESVRDPRWRAEVLTDLSRTIPPEGQDAVLAAALEASMTVGDQLACSRALAALRCVLDGTDLATPRSELPAGASDSKATGPEPDDVDGDAAAGIVDEHWRMQAAVDTEPAAVTIPTWRADALARSGEGAAAAEVADAQENATAAAAVRLRLASAAPGDLAWDAAEAAADAVQDPEERLALDRARALALARAGRPADGLTIARRVGDETTRGHLLAELAPLVGADVLREALGAAEQLTDPAARGRVLALLTPQVRESVPALVASHVRTTLGLLSEGTRLDFMAGFEALLPGLGDVVGPSGLDELAETVVAVYRCWP